MKQPYNTALYMRLSRDDENYGDSVSIETQRTILRQFAKENQLHVMDEYIDDGWSGTNFERPNFKRMMDDVELGKINCIVTKDLSRFGREHVMMDYYLEFVFPEKKIRYIAVSDNEDTEKGLSDFVPFKNLFNEWFAKDTSRKVKTALHAKFAAGQHICTYAPIGYKKHSEVKNLLEIDEETRWIVEKIFDLAYRGAGAAKITNILIDEQIPTAGWLNYTRYGKFAHIYAEAPEEKRYAWTISQVKCILKDEIYIGNSVYRQFGKKHATCTAHYIRYDTLYTYVHARLMYWWQQAQADEAKLTERILKAGDKENDAQTKARTASLTRAEKRKEELDRLFSKLYEDWASERITQYNFNTLSKKYQTEQEKLLVKIDKLTAELSAEQQSVIDAEKWIASIKKCARPTELTADLFNSLIEKIVIHEGKDSQNGMKAQPIEIYYRFIGKID